jgi:hypothetical protein
MEVDCYERRGGFTGLDGGKFDFFVMLLDERVLVLEKNGADEGAWTA